MNRAGADEVAVEITDREILMFDDRPNYRRLYISRRIHGAVKAAELTERTRSWRQVLGSDTE